MQILLKESDGVQVGKEWQGENGRGYVILMPPSSANGDGLWIPFTITIAAAGTPTRLTTTTIPCKKVIVCSPTGTNAGPAAVGGNNTVRATSGAVVGIELVPGNTPLALEIDDMMNLWVDHRVSGGKVCGAYLT